MKKWYVELHDLICVFDYSFLHMLRCTIMLIILSLSLSFSSAFDSASATRSTWTRKAQLSSLLLLLPIVRTWKSDSGKQNIISWAHAVAAPNSDNYAFSFVFAPFNSRLWYDTMSFDLEEECLIK